MIARVFALIATLFVMMAATTAAQAQSLCTITAGASRTETNVSGSGTLAHLRVLASAGTSDIFEGGAVSPESTPTAPAFACPGTQAAATAGAAVRFNGSIVNSGGTNNRVNLSGAGNAFTFAFDGGGTLSKAAGSRTIFYTPSAGQTSQAISGTGTLTLSSTISQYAAGSHVGSFEVGAGNEATAGRDTASTYTIIVTVVAAPSITSLSPTSGSAAGGNSVTITGSNFSASGNAVTFGGNTASITSQSATSITVTAPAHAAGAVDVVVTTADSQTATATNGYTYAAAPTVTSAAPSSGPTGGANTVVLTGTNLTGTTAVSFGGNPATGFTVNSATQITATAPSGSAGTVSISVTTGGGTGTLTNGYTYVTAPTVTSVAPTSGPTAGGTSVTITGTNLTGATAVAFGANPATGVTINSATQITATAPSGSAGAVSVSVTTAGGTGNLTNGYTYVAAPTITAVSPASGSAAGGTAVTITGTNLTGAAAVTFGGVAGTVTANTATSISVTTPGGTGTVNVAVTTAGGTATATNAYSYIAALVVTPGAATGASVGASYSQANPASGGTAPYTYALASGALPAGTTLNTSTGSVTGTPTTAGAFSYAIQATDSQGSPATATGGTVSGTITKGSQTITFAALANASLSASPLTLSATSSSGLTVAFTSATTGVCTVSGTTLTLLTTGTCTVNADQAGDANYNAATQVQRSFTVTPATLAVTPGAATGTTVGDSYSQANPASGGTAPYTYALASGALPAGTTLNTGTGAVTGTPTTAGAFSYAIQATDSQGAPVTATGATVSGTIARANQTITFAALSDASLSASPLMLSATSSSGLTVAFTSATTGVCTVSGTTLTLVTTGTCTVNADQAGNANYNAASQVQRSFTVTPSGLSVTPGAATGATVGASYSQSNPASGGTAPYTYALASGALPAGTTLNTSTGSVTGTPTTAGAFSYAIQATDSQGAPVTATGATVSGSIAKANQTITFAALSNASLSASPLTLSATSSSGLTVAFSSATTPVCTVSGTTLTLVTTGTCTINADQAGNANYNAAAQVQRSFTVTPATLAVTPGAATGATVGASYSQSNPASGGTAPYTYALASGALPAGTTLNTSTGSVTGTPTTAGAFSYAIQATDSQGAPVTVTGATVSGSIAKANQTITFAALSNASLSASPLTLSATSSSGLTVAFSSATTPVCTVSGTALTLVTTGTCTVNADQAGNANYNAAAQVQRSFTVTPATLAVTPGAATGATVGASYSQLNPASGGTAPYTYALASGALPAGTTLNTSTGAVTGTPTTAGGFSYAIQATDSQGAPVTATGATVSGTIAKGNQTITFAALSNASISASPLTLSATASSGLTVAFTSTTTPVCTVSGTTLTLVTTGTCTINADQAGNANYNAATQVQRSFTVTLAVMVVTPGAASGATVGASYSQSNPASGGTAPYAYALASGALPAGTTLNTSTGSVTGTPTTAGAFSYAIQATDSQGAPVTATGATVSGSIAKANQTITFAALSNASLSASPLTLSATSSSGLTVAFSSATTPVCTVSGTTLTLVTTGTCTVNADQAGNANYNAAAQVQRSFTVTPATLAVTPGAATGATVGASYSQSNPASGGTAPYTYALASGALPAGTSLSTSTGAVTGTPTTAGAFSYAIQATDSQGAPVTATGATVSGTIAKATQTITFGALSNASLSASPLSLSATSSSGLTVAFSSATTPVCTVSGTTLTLVTTGTCTINADQAGNANYNTATQVQRSFTVTAPVPPAPVASNRSGVSVVYNTATQIDLSSSISGSYTAIAVASGPAHGSTSVSGAVVTYTPTAGYSGADSFTYTATGPGGTSAPATVSLTVAAPLPPVVTPPPSPPVVSGVGGSASIDLVSTTANPVTSYRITVDAQFGAAVIEEVSLGLPTMMQVGGGRTFRLRYTSAPNFMGVDRVTIVAVGPGGESAPAVFTFNVPGKAPDLAVRAATNGSVTVSPTASLPGGPFQGLRITRQPAFGTATVSGLILSFAPGAADAGATSLDYVVLLPFGESAAGRIDLQSDPAPVVPTITATTIAGRPVTVSLTANARNGPFTAAAITSLSIPGAGTAVLTPGGTASARTYDLTFTPAGAFSGRVDVNFTLSNAGATANGVVQITVDPRPNPALDPDVRGLVSSQADAARRFARAQTDNFNQRLEQIRGGDNSSRNGLSLNMSALMSPRGQPDIVLQQRQGLQLDADGLDPRDRAEREAERAMFDRISDDRRPGSAAARTAGPAGPDGSQGYRPSAVGVWAGGSLDWGHRDADGLRDTRFSTSGLSAGVDMKVTDALILGGGVGYGGDHATVGDRGTASDGRSTVGVAYGSWRASSDLHLSGMIGHGDLDYDTRRWSTNAATYAFGERSGSMTFGSLGLAYDRRTGGSNQSLYGRMESSRVSLDAFSETGAGLYALTYDAMDVDTLTSNLGVRVDWAIEGRGTVFTPSLRMEWRHEFEQPGDQALTYADWLASPRYGLGLQGWSRDSLSVDLGGHWIIDDRLNLSAGYRTTLGSNASTQGLQFRLMTRF
ncbi:putative Ig domain-containing protein [Brevundimonas sp.]|uniref:putative Ig domain-containing protein n=1 Tax=Brevundimonas sp. TaxID=1871086 RepID=UPI003D0EA91C